MAGLYKRGGRWSNSKSRIFSCIVYLGHVRASQAIWVMRHARAYDWVTGITKFTIITINIIIIYYKYNICI